MSDQQMARLGRMVDEALSEAGAKPEVANAPATVSEDSLRGA